MRKCAFYFYTVYFNIRYFLETAEGKKTERMRKGTRVHENKQVQRFSEPLYYS